jgi:hypothetical protein
MPGWAAGVAGTFAISAVSAYIFLLLRCRGIGYPFGRRARWWAMTVVVVTALLATGLGVAAVAVSDHLRAVYIGVLLPSGLWLGNWSAPQRSRRGSALLRTFVKQVTVPLRYLNDCMGDDMQHWCDVRSAAVATSPELIYDAAEHYYLQVANQVKDRQKHEDLDSRLGSIKHKVSIARLARLGTTRTAKLRDDLQDHPATRANRKYAEADPDLLARRLESDAENELQLLLACIYQLGFRKLVTYRGFKPAPQPTRLALVLSRSGREPPPRGGAPARSRRAGWRTGRGAARGISSPASTAPCRS